MAVCRIYLVIKGARVWWNQGCVFLEHIGTVNGLFLRFKFFRAQDWFPGLLGSISEPTLQSLWNEALKLLDNPCFGRTCIIQEICSRKTYPCAGSDCGE
jgi:hypothetical protein